MNHSYQQKSLTTNPCGEISLGGFEHCHIDHSFSILDIFAKMDDISNAAFTRFAARKPLLSEGKFGRKASDRRERDCDQTSLG
jgi:hypothetical protein